MRSTLYFILTILLTSCSSISYLGIETHNPAEVTFPDNVGKVLVVNNAVPQPPEVGYEYKLYGVLQDTAKVSADSALYDAAHAMGEAIVAMEYFNDVLLYHYPTRNDDEYFTDKKLKKEEVEALCEETETDAIISFDRLLFNLTKDITAYPEGFLRASIRVDISGVVRTYLPGRETPLATVLVSDSIFWEEEASDMDVLDFLIPPPENILRVAGVYIGNVVYPYFVPHWQRESRWYFTGNSSRWKEATAYVAAEKWDLAAERWQAIYDRSNKEKEQAKATSNIALSYEMRGDFQQALDWAIKSKDLFIKNGEKANKETKLLTLYVEALKERINSDKKLNVQFGKE